MTALINWLRENSPAFRHRYPAEVVTPIGNRLDQYTGNYGQDQ